MINVLIAEDNIPVSIHLTNVIYFTKEVQSVFIINKGDEVYLAIKKLKPEVVVLDLKMPGEDGISILEKIDNDFELKNTKVIVYSGEPSYISKVIGFSCVEMFFDKMHNCEEIAIEIKRIAKIFQDERLDKNIYGILCKIGFSPAHRGTKLLKDCIEIGITDNEENLNKMYKKISLKKNQSSYCIKANIQRAVNHMWKYANKEKIRKIFRLADDEKPSPKNIVPMIIYYLEK